MNDRSANQLSDKEQSALKLCQSKLELVPADAKYASPNNPTRGKCYLASIALLQFLGGKASGYSLRRGIDTKNVPHYWVQNEQGAILDPTADQYRIIGEDPPYTDSRGVGYRGNIKRHLPLLDGMRVV